MTENANADEVTRLRAEVADLRQSARTAWDVHAEHVETSNVRLLHWQAVADEERRRAESAEAALTGVRELCEAKEDAQRRANERYAERNVVDLKSGRVFEGVPILTCREVRAALDPASPATRPSPAPADDEGTGTGAAPSEGHSEAQGEQVRHATRTETRTVCNKCGQQYGLFHKHCDGLWIEQRRTVSEWWS
jgi:hypothetical protein